MIIELSTTALVPHRIAQKFCPEKNFLFFALAHRWRNFIRRILFLSEILVTLKFLLVATPLKYTWLSSIPTVPHDHQLLVTIWKCSLYRRIDLYPSLMSLLSYSAGPYRQSCCFPPLLWTVCSKLRPRSKGCTSSSCYENKKHFSEDPRGHGVFIRWLFLGEHLALWAKINSAKFLR